MGVDSHALRGENDGKIMNQMLIDHLWLDVLSNLQITIA